MQYELLKKHHNYGFKIPEIKFSFFAVKKVNLRKICIAVFHNKFVTQLLDYQTAYLHVHKNHLSGLG
jgi:hypothetical protein